jgi:hypothetical protein
MQRLLDYLQVLFYVVAITVMVALGGYALTLLHELSVSLKQERVQHEQMRRDHATTSKDHEGQREAFALMLERAAQQLRDHQRLIEHR